MARFGGLMLPQVQSLDYRTIQKNIDKTAPNRVGNYRAFGSNYGRAASVSGLFKATSQVDALRFIESLHAYAGVIETFDPQDGKSAFTAIMSDPSFEIVVGDWWTGKYEFTYSASFQETA